MQAPDKFSGDNTQDLSALAKQIRDACQAVQAGTRSALRAALDAGDALIAARDRVADGRWTRWLKENCFIGLRSAQLFMQLARHRDEVEAATMRVADLSLRAARRLVMKPGNKSSKPKKPPTPALLDAWKAALPAERTALFDSGIELPEFLGAISLAFRRQLEARLRKQTADDYAPNYQLTMALRTAMSHLQTDEKAALNALRGLARLLNGDFHELSVGFQEVVKEKRRRAA